MANWQPPRPFRNPITAPTREQSEDENDQALTDPYQEQQLTYARSPQLTRFPNPTVAQHYHQGQPVPTSTNMSDPPYPSTRTQPLPVSPLLHRDGATNPTPPSLGGSPRSQSTPSSLRRTNRGNLRPFSHPYAERATLRGPPPPLQYRQGATNWTPPSVGGFPTPPSSPGTPSPSRSPERNSSFSCSPLAQSSPQRHNHPSDYFEPVFVYSSSDSSAIGDIRQGIPDEDLPSSDSAAGSVALMLGEFEWPASSDSSPDEQNGPNSPPHWDFRPQQ